MSAIDLEKQIDAGLLAQAAETVSVDLLEELVVEGELSFDRAEQLATSHVKAATAGWNLACQRRQLEIEDMRVSV